MDTEALLERYGPAYRWLATTTVLLGLIALGMSITIIDVATPYVQGAFGMSASQEQWLSTGFLAATTISIMVAPWCMKAFGERKTYIATLCLFIFGSVVGGMSTDTGVIIFARIALGISAGMIRPVAMSAMFTAFGPRRRGIATAIYGMSLGLPLTLAEVFGGWLVETLSWRWTFYVTLPFSVLSILLAWFFLPWKRTDRMPRFDWAGLILLSVAVFALLTALANWLRWGVDSNGVLGLLAVAAVVGTLYVSWEIRAPHPMLDLRVFLNPAFASGSLAMFLFGGAFYAIVYLLPLFSETVQGYSPVETGMIFLPSTAVLALLVPLVGHLSDRYSPLLFAVPAIFFAMAGTWGLAHADTATSFLELSMSMGLIAVGMSAFPPPMLSRAIGALPNDLMPYGAGAINFVMQLGGALFTSVSVLALQVTSVRHAAALNENLVSGHAATSAAMDQMAGALSRIGGLGADRLHEAVGYLLGRIVYTQGHILGFDQVFVYVTLALLTCLVPVILLGLLHHNVVRALAVR
jgi:MFS transporter, DHA2 family, multidrug resistance protein